MSEPDNFLTRWAQRKRDVEAAEGKAKPPSAEDAAARKGEGEGAPAKPVAAAAESKSPEPAFDLNSLPSIDSITATTNVSAFLNPAVPEALRRAALRRLWALNPPTQEALLMAEYAGDFTDAGGMAGFGALEMTDELRQMARQIVGGIPDVPQESAPEPSGAAAREDVTRDQTAPHPAPTGKSVADETIAPIASASSVPTTIATEAKVIEQDSTAENELLRCNKTPDATEQAADLFESKRPTFSRGRGGALPQ